MGTAADLDWQNEMNDSDGPSNDGNWLAGRCLISMPSMQDPRFRRTVIFLCSHDEEGAMGLVINRAHDNITFQKLCKKLKIDGEADDAASEENQAENADETMSVETQLEESSANAGAPKPNIQAGIQILSGGPVEIGRGFVLHRASSTYENTLNITEDVALCATMDALQSLAVGEGPPDARVALGYAGWGAGQLEEEILENAWLVCDADADLVLELTPDDIYDAALAKLGVNIAALTSASGHA